MLGSWFSHQQGLPSRDQHLSPQAPRVWPTVVISALGRQNQAGPIHGASQAASPACLASGRPCPKRQGGSHLRKTAEADQTLTVDPFLHALTHTQSIYAHMHTCTCAHTCTYRVHAYLSTHMHTHRVHAHMHTCAHTHTECMHTCTLEHTQSTHDHTCTHAHTQRAGSSVDFTDTF